MHTGMKTGKMSFGKGYLGNNKGASEPAEPEQGMNDGGHGAIHEHLKDMHAQTGKAHSHIEHNGDGSHMAHHISADGQVSGPEEHGDCPGGMCGGSGMEGM